MWKMSHQDTHGANKVTTDLILSLMFGLIQLPKSRIKILPFLTENVCIIGHGWAFQNENESDNKKVL